MLEGQISALNDDEDYVVRDVATWASVFEGLNGAAADSAHVPPEIDFAKTLVVGAVRQHTTGGYAVKITRVAYGDGLAVTVEETEPGEGCMAAQTLTQPHQFVTVTLDAAAKAALAEVKSANDAQFVVRKKRQDCN